MLTKDEAQGVLPLRPTPARESYDVPIEVILRQPSRLSVMRLQIQASGMDDGQVGDALGIDAGQWSRILKGTSHFPTNLYHQFNQITGAHYVLLWDVWQAGYEPDSLRPRLSDIEEQLEAEREKVRDLEKQLETITVFWRRGMNGAKQ